VNTSVLFSSSSDHWATPAEVYANLKKEFQFNLDPCPLDGSQDGLATLFMPWRAKRVFCNPPYGPDITKWLERATEADVAVFLLPARTDTRWFHTIVLPKAKEIRFIRGRLKFGDAINRAPFPSMVVVFEKGRVLQTPPPIHSQSTRDAIARCISEQKASLPHINTEGGKLWAEDWVKEEVILRLESGAAIHSFDAVASGEPTETRG
jgi:hypothetical protein